MRQQLQNQFDDIVAEKTEWTMMNTASSNFNPRKLVFIGNQCIEFRMTWASKFISCVFIAFGIGGLFIHKLYVLFILMGLIALYYTSFPIVFDKKIGLFIKGRHVDVDPFMDYIEINLAEIYALQLIGGHRRSEDGPGYNNYQINLINKDSKRINVLYYHKKEQAKNDARILKAFLGTRLWDAT